MNKPELLAPAGDFESLEATVHFGADAVYIGGNAFSMRASPQNFDEGQLFRAVQFAHSHGVKIYLTCNTLPRNDELALLPAFLAQAKVAGVDALIISDLGVMELAKRHAPGVELHMSTQTGIVNYASASALHALGAARVVLARELSLAEITDLRTNTPRALEIEAFVHGAMCVSFSGRCLLSDYMTARDANRGRCAQPCRWSYTLCEEKRPGEHMPVFEDAEGTHILNARDLCMIEHIPALMRAGITSLKIEGRAKSAYYVAAVTNAYRIAIDRFFSEKKDYTFDPELLREVEKVSHRDYCTGFFFGPIEKGQIYGGAAYMRSWDIVATIEANADGLAVCRERNPFSTGVVEALEPGKTGRPVTIKALYDENGQKLDNAIHPDMRVLLKLDRPLTAHTMLRKPVD